MRRDDFVDFFEVAEGYLGTHKRMEDWAHWVRVRHGGSPTAPMFRQYQPEAWEARETRRAPKSGINTLETLAAERALQKLDPKHKDAIRWVYLWSRVSSLEARVNGWPHTVSDIRRSLGVTSRRLWELIGEGRSMLRNHGIDATN